MPSKFDHAEIKDPRLRNLFDWLRESPNWFNRHPVGPVHWDMRCERCGHTIEDAVSEPRKGNLTVSRSGIRIRQMKGFYNHFVLCTKCVPESATDNDDD